MKNEATVLEAARELAGAGYAVREIRFSPDGDAEDSPVGEVVAEATVTLHPGPYRFPVVLRMDHEGWTYEVEKPGQLGDLFSVPPGTILSARAAGDVVLGWWLRWACAAEVDAWRELVGEADLSVLPSVEEIAPLLERSPTESRRAAELRRDPVFVVSGRGS